MSSVVGRQGLIRQVQFPKIVLPTAATVAETFSFAIGLIALAFLFIPYHERLSIWVLAIPLIAAVQLVFSLAVAILLAAANAFYRDVANVMGHLLRLLFYVSPALYALWEVPNEELAEADDAQPLHDPPDGLPDGHLGHGDGRPRDAAGLPRARDPADGLDDPRRARGRPLQARRARLRADPVSEQPATRPIAVEIRGLGIHYDLRLTRRTTIKGSLVGMLRRNQSAPTHFWALRHLDLQIFHGEAIGLIGPNGAGKSTLLLALAGILQPSEGSIAIDGRVSTLLTLGAGFDQELTGRDNIALAGAFLGIEHGEMDRLTPSIIEFADIGAFIDAPVKTYSMGMKARLGFSIATAITPDILLLDEVLGTGDQVFRTRSQARVRELISRARVVVLVTHDLSYVTEFCGRAILLEKGQIIHDGDPAETVDLYRRRVRESKLLAEADAERFAKPPEPQPATT